MTTWIRVRWHPVVGAGELLVHVDEIAYVEAAKERTGSLIWLRSGERLHVAETMDEVLRLSGVTERRLQDGTVIVIHTR